MATQKWCSKHNCLPPCPEYDIKLLTNIKRGYIMTVVWKAELTDEMIAHLKAHEANKDRIPHDIYDRLREDDEENFPRENK